MIEVAWRDLGLYPHPRTNRALSGSANAMQMQKSKTKTSRRSSREDFQEL